VVTTTAPQRRLFPGDAPKAPGAGYEPLAGPWYDPVAIPKLAGEW
jgi:hypothetical protein